MKRGDQLWIERDEQKEQATVLMASENGDSLMVVFEAVFHGYVGMMPLLRTDGVYRDLIENKPVNVEAIEQ